MDNEKVKLFIQHLGIEEAVFTEGDPVKAAQEYAARVTEAAKKDPEHQKAIEAATYGKVIGGLTNKVKKAFGFTEKDTEGKTVEELIAAGIDKVKGDLSADQKGMLEKLQSLAAVAEEKAALEAEMKELPVKIRKQFEHETALERLIAGVYAETKGFPLPLEDFRLLAQNKLFHGGDFVFDDSGALRKKVGSGYETDKSTFKPVDYGAVLKNYAASLVPAQNPAPANTPAPPKAGSGKVHPNAIAALKK